jgi:hypothetical protein
MLERFPALSFADAVKFTVPAVVAGPLIVNVPPLAEDVRPLDKPETVHTYPVPVPPTTVSVCEYACPVTATGKLPGPGVMFSSGELTTI